MTCDAFFLIGVLAAIAGVAFSIVAVTAPPGVRYVAWLVAAVISVVASLYLTVPWLAGYTEDCVVFNYKLSLAKIPPIRVQPYAAGSGADDSHSIRSHTHRVGWFGNSRFRDIRD